MVCLGRTSRAVHTRHASSRACSGSGWDTRHDTHRRHVCVCVCVWRCGLGLRSPMHMRATRARALAHTRRNTRRRPVWARRTAKRLHNGRHPLTTSQPSPDRRAAGGGTHEVA